MELKIKHIKIAARICLIILLLRSSITLHVSCTTLLIFIAITLTYIDVWSKLFSWLRSRQQVSQRHATAGFDVNPYKGKTGQGYLTKDKEASITQAVAESVLYDAGNVASLKNFEVIKRQTECIFAKKSRLWGSPDYDYTFSLEANTERLLPTFYKFTMAFQDLGLDGFVVELPGELFGADIRVFGDAVRRVLVTLQEADVALRKRALLKGSQNWSEQTINNHLRHLVVNTKMWGRRSWVFEFNWITFFITSFAPFYPETNSRFNFGCKNCYILFQPEISFAVHDLPPDTAETNWTCPKTVRDKIRIAFHDAGREYEAPMKLKEPMVYEIVKKVDPEDEMVQWWLPAAEQFEIQTSPAGSSD